MIVTKHICRKVLFRANKTIEKNPTVNINAARRVCVGWEIAGEEAKKGSRGEEKRGEERRREEDRKEKRHLCKMRKTRSHTFVLKLGFIHHFCPFSSSIHPRNSSSSFTAQ